jgi:hypothetical protein
MLEPAARAPGANGRIRQNLALAYALAGDWQKARRVAEQDLSPAEVAGRLEQWAAFANPTAAHSQVATLLGVTPIADSGRPVRLALASELPVYAAAEVPATPLGAAEPVKVAVPHAQPAAVAEAAPQLVAQAEPAPAPQTYAYQAPQPVEDFSALPEEEFAIVQVPAVSNEGSKQVASEQVAAAVETLVKTPAPAERAAFLLASAPIQTFKTGKSAVEPRPSLGGRFVVQLGAFRTVAQVEKAWAAAQLRYSLEDAEPVTTMLTIAGKGTFHRLSVSGFGSSVDANRLCQSIRSRSGDCFVREAAGGERVPQSPRYARRGV